MHRLAHEIYQKTDPELIRDLLKPLGFARDERVVEKMTAHVKTVSQLTIDLQNETKHLPGTLLTKLKNYVTNTKTKSVIEACSTHFRQVFLQHSCEPGTIVQIGIALAFIAGTRISAEAILKNPSLAAEKN
ncbi:hypothetical protein A3B61_00060 [Candidatus Peribacteria bacterium RIFCSPLOWO2_01_FULL_53_10]|nr:MAG: hypothetical protein A3B61_00060 [Candidatus Peribacteria bacterium RIFCSPLOWO2_01_FULL_53_10]